MRTGTVLVAAGLWLGGCVTVPVDDAPVRAPIKLEGAVVIPIGTIGDDERPLVEFYRGIFQRMREAYGIPGKNLAPDLETLRSLLQSYRRDDGPAWVRATLQGYADAEQGLTFELHAARASRLEAVVTEGVGDEIGEPLHLDFVLPPLPDGPTHLGGDDSDEPVAFRVAVEIEDRFVDGSTRTHRQAERLRLPTSMELATEPLRLGVTIDLPVSAAVRRTIHARADLWPGYVGRNGRRVPVRQTTLAATVATQWPRGYEPIREKPLLTLREAIRRGDAAHFPHVYLGAVMAPPADREAVLTLLVDQVRLGRPDQALVAMAALAALTDVAAPIGDRERWLAWWQSRR